MPVLIWLAIIATIVFVAWTAAAIYYEWDDAGPVIAGLCFIAVVGLWIGVLAVHFGARYSETNCKRYAEQTDREVRFLRQSFTQWDCYVLTDNGWVTRGNVYSGVPVNGDG